MEEGQRRRFCGGKGPSGMSGGTDPVAAHHTLLARLEWLGKAMSQSLCRYASNRGSDRIGIAARAQTAIHDVLHSRIVRSGSRGLDCIGGAGRTRETRSPSMAVREPPSSTRCMSRPTLVASALRALKTFEFGAISEVIVLMLLPRCGSPGSSLVVASRVLRGGLRRSWRYIEGARPA